MTATALAIARIKDLFASVMLTGIYSLLSACFFVLMDAVDVAFTEAAVGAGIATLLMLVALALTGADQKPGRHNTGLALLVVVVTGALLVYGTLDMPAFASPDTPVHQHISPRYLSQSRDEIGVPNVVTSVLASYRGYDTFGETVVVFTAGMGVLALLGMYRRRHTASVVSSMQHYRVLRVVSKILIPPILLFALYVQFHGDYGPGGGFQAGVIFAAGIILYAMLFGLDTALRVINQGLVRILAALGVLFYGSVGVVSMLNGGNFLDYSVLLAEPVAGQHIGILLVEFGVGVTVAAVMIIIFMTFAGRMDR